MADSPKHGSVADRNLLFGILALQMDFISRDALIQAMNAWVLEKSKPLGQILVEQGALAADSHALLEALVEKHLAMHGNDPERSLAAIEAEDGVREELKQIADPDVQASLANVTTPSKDDGKLPKSPKASEVLGEATAGGSRFRILRPHARGGLGEVFFARDEELHREVALKEIQERHAHHPEHLARFVREAEVTGGLEHPGIVPVYGLGQYADGRPFYAMRFIRGESLKDAIDRYHKTSPDASAPGAHQASPVASAPGVPPKHGVLTPPRSPAEHNLKFRQLLARFIAVCNTMAYAHSRGVIHRDLKPANIMLGNYGETLVVDWGLAKVVASAQWPVASSEPDASARGPAEPPLITMAAGDSDLTQAGKTLGTPAFMSPEQAAGKLDRLGPASDIYSLGATLYVLLTGKAPFVETDVALVLGRVERGDFPPPRERNKHVPASLEAICLKAMALKPEDRYRSAKALAGDLEHWLADEAVSAHAEPWPARLGRWVRHHKGLVGSLSAACLILAAAAIAAGFWDRAKKMEGLRDAEQVQRGRAEENEALVRRLLYLSRINLAEKAWHEGQIGPMRELLEGQRPQHTGKEDLRGFEWYYLWRLAHPDLFTLEGHADRVNSVAFSPDGQRLASASDDKTVKVWNARTGQEILTLQGHTEGVNSVAFSPDGQRLASASHDKTVKVWDVRTGQEVLTLQGHTGYVYCVAFSPNGQHLASASFDNTVKVWDARTGQESLTLKGHADRVNGVAFSPNSQRLASASTDKTVKLWDSRTGKESLTLKRYTEPVYSVAFSSDGQRLASPSVDNTAKVWDARTGQEVLTLRGHTHFVTCVAFSMDGERLASASYDNAARVWDARTGQEVLTLRGHTHFVTCVAFSPDGQRLASASKDGTVKVWDAGTLQESFTLQRHALQVVFGVAFSPDGQRLASASWDDVKVLDARTGQESLTLKGHTWYCTGVAFSPEGQRLASASLDKTVKIWDARSGQEILTIKGHTSYVHGVAFSPDGQCLASASEDQTVKVWDARTGQARLTLNGHTAPAVSLAFSPDGQRLASASWDNTVKVWDARNGQETLTLKGHTNSVVSVGFSRDGQRLASASNDGTVKVWNAATGQESLTLKGHTTFVTSVAFSPDGQRLASANLDNTVKIWDAGTGQEILTLKGHSGSVFCCVAFSPDGQRLASASNDGTVKIWDARPLTEQSRLERQALCFFRFVAETLVLKEEMLERIRRDQTISEPVRQQALAWMEDYRETAYQLNTASQAVGRRANQKPAAYRLALRQAEAACRLESNDGPYLTTLGMAQYRSGQYPEALKTLTLADKMNSARFQGPYPADLAFLAMTHHQLGHKAQAAATLARLREVMKKPEWATNAEAKDVLQEAETLLEGKAGKAKP